MPHITPDDPRWSCSCLYMPNSFRAWAGDSKAHLLPATRSCKQRACHALKKSGKPLQGHSLFTCTIWNQIQGVEHTENWTCHHPQHFIWAAMQSEQFNAEICEEEIMAELRSSHVTGQLNNMENTLPDELQKMEIYSKVNTVFRVRAWIRRLIPNSQGASWSWKT